MNNLRLVTLFYFGMTLGTTCLAQQAKTNNPVVVLAGFYTGQQYLDLSSSEREVYASGLFDGLMAAGWLGAKEKSVAQIHDCIPDLTSHQFVAVLDKYVRDHPERWSVHMSVVATEALSKVCTIK